MIPDFIINHFWPALVAWGLVYIADYYLTLYFAKLYRQKLKDFIQFEGSIELTPLYQKDIDTFNPFSLIFVSRLLLSFLVILIIWWISVRYLELPALFLVGMGALFLREAAVLLRHARNIAMALACRDGQGLQGLLSYDRWLSLELSAVEIAAFGLFCLIVAAAGDSWFFLGGGLACLFLGYTHWQRSRKAHRAKTDSGLANPSP